MKSRIPVLVFVLAVPLLQQTPARAAADLTFREFRLRHVCKGGPTPGAICCAADECGTGTCVIDFLAQSKVSGTLTIVIDNDVSDLNGTRLADAQVRALTTILELSGGEILAQTFQQLNGADLDSLIQGLKEGPKDEFGFGDSEGLLEENVAPAVPGGRPDVSFLFFRTLDAETIAALRERAGLPPGGPEKLVVQEDKAKPLIYVNHFSPATAGDIESKDTDPFASVLRVKLTARFVAPKPPECL